MIKNKFYIIIPTAGECGYSGKNYPTDYDFTDACKYCGTGAKPIFDLEIKLRSQYPLLNTLNGDLLLSDFLVSQILESLPEFSNNLRKTNNSLNLEVKYFLLQSEFILPRMSSDSSGIQTEDQCLHCKRDGHYDVLEKAPFPKKGNVVKTLEYRYPSLKVNDLKGHDVLMTIECFGKSNLFPKKNRTFSLAKSRIAVSQKVLDVLIKHEIQMVYYPILLGD